MKTRGQVLQWCQILVPRFQVRTSSSSFIPSVDSHGEYNSLETKGFERSAPTLSTIPRIRWLGVWFIEGILLLKSYPGNGYSQVCFHIAITALRSLLQDICKEGNVKNIGKWLGTLLMQHVGFGTSILLQRHHQGQILIIHTHARTPITYISHPQARTHTTSVFTTASFTTPYNPNPTWVKLIYCVSPSLSPSIVSQSLCII